MLRKPLLLAARSQTARTVVERTPMTRAMVDRFVAGADLQGALPIVADVTTDRHVTLDFLREDTTDRAPATATVTAYEELLAALGAAGLAPRAEGYVMLSEHGQLLDVV